LPKQSALVDNKRGCVDDGVWCYTVISEFGAMLLLAILYWVDVKYFGLVSRYHSDTAAVESIIITNALSEKDMKARDVESLMPCRRLLGYTNV